MCSIFAITKDGVTVAKEIELENRFENMGAQMVKEVASKTSDVAGDGTTTATVLAQAMFREGAKLVAAGNNPMEIKRGIDKAVTAVVEELKKLTKPTKDHKEIAQVGTISANADASIGKIIAEAMDKVGKEGVITVEEGQSISGNTPTDFPKDVFPALVEQRRLYGLPLSGYRCAVDSPDRYEKLKIELRGGKIKWTY